jgi:hypothetical protein
MDFEIFRERKKNIIYKEVIIEARYIIIIIVTILE